ncbi:unnamed protein product [Linum tenue]|uniref:Uncharacterized protein n=1 Tax=Linum tenue TaxID=586396 RepID=A0AAV0HUP5_9ROSI|nr:unnamed protein product [Linum tenue]
METERLRPAAAAAGSYQDQEEENSSAFSGCNCFGSLFSRWGTKSASSESNSYLLMQNRGGGKTGEDENQQQKTEPSSWVMNQMKKLKEVSEMVAGPKWKNFIRQKQRRNQKFTYNAESYALNFDCGLDEEEYDYVPGFSQRFAAVPVDNRNREAFGL